MEDKQLSTEQSLSLISKMIENTRRNFNDHGGTMFLVWGYTTIAVTIAVTLAFLFTGNGAVMWGWWVLPIVGGCLTYRHFSKYDKGVRTQLDKIVSYVWQVFTVACIACGAFSSVSSGVAINILFVIGLMIGMSTALTGLIIKFRPVIVGGFVGMGLSFAILPLQDTIWQLLIFAALFLLAQVIPGHLLNVACKKEAQERR
jgi:hypothetical protein